MTAITIDATVGHESQPITEYIHHQRWKLRLELRREIESPRPLHPLILWTVPDLVDRDHTHGDSSLITAMLAAGDPAVHVFTPADARRVGVVLEDALRSTGRVNIVVAGKHGDERHPVDTVDEERAQGLAVWPHLSDCGEPDLTLVCAGDLPASVTRDAVNLVRARHRCRVRVVNVHDLAALASPALHQRLGSHAAVVVATLGHPGAIWGLLGGRLNRPTEVVGWREPPHPMPQRDLARYCGLDVDGITSAAASVLAEGCVLP